MMKFKLRGWPQGMMGTSMRMRMQLVIVDHFQVKMSRYSVPEHIALVKACMRAITTRLRLKGSSQPS
ncbi:hypothetical protein X975_15840, partial [Stegodyphus mimosarum]